MVPPHEIFQHTDHSLVSWPFKFSNSPQAGGANGGGRFPLLPGREAQMDTQPSFRRWGYMVAGMWINNIFVNEWGCPREEASNSRNQHATVDSFCLLQEDRKI